MSLLDSLIATAALDAIAHRADNAVFVMYWDEVEDWYRAEAVELARRLHTLNAHVEGAAYSCSTVTARCDIWTFPAQTLLAWMVDHAADTTGI